MHDCCCCPCDAGSLSDVGSQQEPGGSPDVGGLGRGSRGSAGAEDRFTSGGTYTNSRANRQPANNGYGQVSRARLLHDGQSEAIVPLLSQRPGLAAVLHSSGDDCAVPASQSSGLVTVLGAACCHQLCPQNPPQLVAGYGQHTHQQQQQQLGSQQRLPKPPPGTSPASYQQRMRQPPAGSFPARVPGEGQPSQLDLNAFSA
jgi:hypothetical protein